jgi:adiponectin receptor
MSEASLHYTLVMGALYLTGALLYATRVPERFLPGRCDIWFQSHQIFHLLVVAAAFVHYHGISEMALQRIILGPNCPTESLLTNSSSIITESHREIII